MKRTTVILLMLLYMIPATLTVGQNPVGAWAASKGKMYVDNETSRFYTAIKLL